MDRIEIPGYEQTNLDAAHIVWDDGKSLTIVAAIAEPQARNDRAAGAWSDDEEQAFVASATAAALDAWGEPDSQDYVAIWLTWDPGRDQQVSNPLVEINADQRPAPYGRDA